MTKTFKMKLGEEEIKLRLLTDDEWDEIEQKADINKCPTCLNKRFDGDPTLVKVTGDHFGKINGQYKFDGEIHECDCKVQMALFRHYVAANIPRQYMTLDWIEYQGEAKEDINRYIEHWANLRHQGIGMTLWGDLGTGKAQPLDAKILTPSGWTTMGEIKVGDAVISSSGTPTTVVGVFPQGEQDIYEITFQDGSKTRATSDHLWTVRGTARKNEDGAYTWVTKTTSELASPRSGNRWQVPVVEPCVFDNQGILPIDPYVMGILLGDGCFRAQKGVRFTTADPEVAAEVDSRLRCSPGTENMRVSKHPAKKIEYSIVRSDSTGVNTVLSALKELGLEGRKSVDKFIPELYLYASVEDRWALLKGLMDAEGSVSSHGSSLEFSTSSPQLRDGFLFLLRSLGGTGQFKTRKTTHSDSYRIHPSIDGNPFLLSRKADARTPIGKYGPKRAIASIKFVGRGLAQCISVSADNGLYVTDDFIVTHNTFAATSIAKMLIKRGQKVYFLRFRDMIATINLEGQARIDRWEAMRSIPFLILDEVYWSDSTDRQMILFGDQFEALIRYRTDWNLPTILTTNHTPSEMAQYFPRIQSLLEPKQYVVNVVGLDYRLTNAIKENVVLAMEGEVRPLN